MEVPFSSRASSPLVENVGSSGYPDATPIVHKSSTCRTDRFTHSHEVKRTSTLSSCGCVGGAGMYNGSDHSHPVKSRHSVSHDVYLMTGGVHSSTLILQNADVVVMGKNSVQPYRRAAVGAQAQECVCNYFHSQRSTACRQTTVRELEASTSLQTITQHLSCRCTARAHQQLLARKSRRDEHSCRARLRPPKFCETRTWP